MNINPSFTLIFSIIGFKSVEVEVFSNKQEIDVVMEEQTIFGNDVVVSASRVEESILQSPVSIEKLMFLIFKLPLLQISMMQLET